jgi:phosphomannomutase
VLAHDGDADRLAVGVRGFGFVKQDLVIALLAWRKLESGKGPVVVSIDVGLEVEEVVEALGGRLVRARLGKIHEKLQEEPGALMAAEPWKLIDPSWGPWIDGIYQAALLAEMMGERPGLAERLSALPRYPSARISYKLPGESERDSLYARLVEDAAAELSRGAVRITLIDGVRIDYSDGSWILLRRSGTEPKVRVYAQAREKGRLLEMLGRVNSMVKDIASRMGVKLGYEEHLDIPPRPKPFTPP